MLKSFIVVLLSMPLFVRADALTKLPVYTGEIMPTPQNIMIGTKDLDLSKVFITGESDSPQRKYLVLRLEELGVKTRPQSEAAAVRITLRLGNDGMAIPPNKKEGYAVTMRGSDIEIAGHDRLGLLWGISSLLQMIRTENGKVLLHEFSGTDYPYYTFRGYQFWEMGQEWNRRYLLAFKFNALMSTQLVSSVLNQPNPGFDYEGRLWMKSAPSAEWLEKIKKMKELSDLEIAWSLGFPFLGSKEVEFGSEENFNKMMLYFNPIAEAGGKVLIMFDDTRFPINENDRKRFGSGRETDIYFLNKLYKAIKAKNPKSGIIFCPPFYWGPANDPSEQVGESRDDYLSALGKRLPADVQIIWTGNNVFGGKVKKEQVDWITGLTKRKPAFYMNDNGTTHAANNHYSTDPVDIWQWHYEGFYKDVWFYPSTLPLFTSSWLLSGVDYLWNPKAYDKIKSPLRASAKLVGTENVVKLEQLNAALSKFDAYEWTVNRGSVKCSNDIERDLKVLNALWDNASKGPNGDMFDRWTGFGANVRRANEFRNAIREALKNNTFANTDSDVLKKTAQKEAGFHEKQEVILLPDEFTGGIVPSLYRFGQRDPRFCTGVRGRGATANIMRAGFRLPHVPSATYKLLICGQDDDMPQSICKVRITINDNQIFAGENLLKPFQWGIWELPINGTFLKDGDNTIVIEGMDDGGRADGGSFFLVNYIVLKIIN